MSKFEHGVWVIAIGRESTVARTLSGDVPPEGSRFSLIRSRLRSYRYSYCETGEQPVVNRHAGTGHSFTCLAETFGLTVNLIFDLGQTQTLHPGRRGPAKSKARSLLT
jgi:hypothetical protein